MNDVLQFGFRFVFDALGWDLFFDLMGYLEFSFILDVSGEMMLVRPQSPMETVLRVFILRAYNNYLQKQC